MKLYLILYQHKRLIDFQNLVSIMDSDFSKTTLYRYLRRSKIKTYRIKNMIVYDIQDILGDGYLVGRITCIAELAEALKE